MKILYISNIPSPYRVNFFNLLSNHCSLTVLYQKKSSDERNKKWVESANNNYEVVYLDGVSTGVDNALSFDVIGYLKRDYDIIVICGYSSPTEMIAIEYCIINKKRYMIEGDGAFVKLHENTIKHHIKKHLISHSSMCLSTCKNLDEYFKLYGATNIARYHFSSIFLSDIVDVPKSIIEKKRIRDALGLVDKPIILYVGQFIYRKGVDVLLSAAKNIPQCHFLFIGGTPKDEYLSFINNNGIDNVQFIDFVGKDKLKQYYFAADVFVLPTREDIWGLVINEALACGIPSITTSCCNSGLEMIDNGKNGYIVEANNVEQLSNAILLALDNSNDMRAFCVKRSREYTIEKMVVDHVQIFDEYIKK